MLQGAFVYNSNKRVRWRQGLDFIEHWRSLWTSTRWNGYLVIKRDPNRNYVTHRQHWSIGKGWNASTGWSQRSSSIDRSLSPICSRVDAGKETSRNGHPNSNGRMIDILLWPSASISYSPLNGAIWPIQGHMHGLSRRSNYVTWWLFSQVRPARRGRWLEKEVWPKTRDPDHCVVARH